MKGPVEAKVAAATAVPLIATALFGAAAQWHWFTPPPPALAASLTALATGLAGWLAPHTSRTPQLTGAEAFRSFAEENGLDPDQYRAALQHAMAERVAIIRNAPPARSADFALGGDPVPEPAVQPPATGTGGTTP